MKSSKRLLASVVLAAAVVTPSASFAVAQSKPSYAAPDAAVEIARNPKTGLVTWMSGDASRPVARALGAADGATSEQAAAAFLASQSAAFGLRGANAELATMKTSSDGDGRDFVRFQQKYQGVPIIGAELNVQVDRGRNILSVNGRSVGDLALSTQPSVAPADALRLAIGSASRLRGVTAATLVGSTPLLAIHDPRVIGGPAASPALVWRVDVWSANGPDVSEFVLIDAQTGRVAVEFSQIKHAKPPATAKQRVCDAANSVSKYPCAVTDGVPNPGDSGIPDVENAFDFAEATYDFYAKRFGRNSLDGKGLTLVSTTRYQRFSGADYANAFWTDVYQQMVYGKDFASGEDVVGHELTHGFTSFTSNLLYYFQSGSINESLSDTMGELIQRTNDASDGWLLGEDLPIGAIRSMKDPTLYSQPDKMTSTLWTGDFAFTDAGGVHTNSGVGNKAAYLITDGGAFNGKKVKGIGIDKAAAIYYRVDALILQSSADYADLGNALRQACADLVGKKPKNKAGKLTEAFKKKDCKQVAAAVVATELSKQPQYYPIPAEALVCSGDDKPVDKLNERFEASNPTTFKFQPQDFRWTLADDYAASNFHSFAGYGTGQFDSSLTETAALAIPAKAYLRFAHYYNMSASGGNYYAGGVVEYSVTDGVWVRVPASMFLDNPYNVTLASETSSVLTGQPAFGGFSGGWTSSRIKLSSLAGKTAKFRFRTATDFRGSGGDGWLIDDVRVYTCKSSKGDVAAAN